MMRTVAGEAHRRPKVVTQPAQLLSSFVAEMQQPRFTVDSTYSYGELVWLRTISGHQVFFAWGWGGQFIYVIPDVHVVLVATENTNDDHDNDEVDLGPFIRDALLPALS